MLDNEPGAANSPAPGTDAAGPQAANPDSSAEPAATAGSAATDTPEATAPRRTRRRATKATAAPAETATAEHPGMVLMLSLMLVYINDDSPGEKRTHGLVDDALDMVVAMLPLVATPMGKAMCDRVTKALARAEINLV